MFLRKKTTDSTKDYSKELAISYQALQEAEAILVGIGAGMSESAGLTYSGERFNTYFSDFHEIYGIEDMYSGGFYPFESPREHWAWWSRQIYYNRFAAPIGKPYLDLLKLITEKNYFILSTNVDHQIQKAGFDKQRLFYTQGDYGLFQCSVPCHKTTYDNEKCVKKMVEEQLARQVPNNSIPYCPKCGAMMTMNLRSDNRFVEDSGWEKAKKAYSDFLEKHIGKRIVYLELGVGMNTPDIIKYPFLRLTVANEHAKLISLNKMLFPYPEEVSQQTTQLVGDIGDILERLLEERRKKLIDKA